MMDETTKQELKKSLEEEHDILVGELKSIAKPDPKMAGNWDARFPQFEAGQTSEYGSHGKLEEEADEVEEYEVRLEAEHSLESRLLEVNKALERMTTGTYGNCHVCKKNIPLERMRANPAADTHVEHA
jgi:RNA polymerase-binding transcription factor DksA